MAQYKVRIVFDVVLNAVTDDAAEKLAKSELMDVLAHSNNTEATHLTSKSPSKTSEFSVESQCWTTTYE